MKKRISFFLVVLFCLLFMPHSINAAAKTSAKVKVNNSFYATVEKSGNYWYMKPLRASDPKISFKERVKFVYFPSGFSLKTGYYTFNSKGRLDTRRMFHTLNAKVGSTRFKGDYYFGEKNGMLTLKKGGWNTIKGEKYYLSNTGRKYVNCWRSGYYLLNTGIIARNMKTPDGFYVGSDGKKVDKSEMNLSGLKKELESMVRSYGGSWSVYVKDLKTGDILSINDKKMKTASIIKLFTMASTYDSIRKGEIVQNAAVNQLLKEMITVSDNEAYNELTRRHSKSKNFLEGCSVVNQKLKALGCKSTECHRTLHPSSSPILGDGKINWTTAKDAGMILEKIYKKQLISAKYSKEMLKLLLGQTRRWKIPAGLPKNVKCANKTGENSSCENDVAIVFGEKTDYVLCVFAETTDSGDGIYGIKEVSKKVYSYLNK